MLISITAANKNNSHTRTSEMTEDAALNLLRSAILMLEPMEETSADLMALNIMSEVTKGNPKSIENGDNGHSLSFRRI